MPFPPLTVQVMKVDEEISSSRSSHRSLPPTPLSIREESNDSETEETFDDELEPFEGVTYCASSAAALAEVKSLPVMRLLTLLDSKEISPASIERATKTFMPTNNDVVVVGAGIVGEPLVTRMIRLLGARHATEAEAWMESYLGLSNAPLIESCAYDSEEGLELLNSKQTPFQRRVFRTSMTYKALQNRLADTESKVKYVVVLRQPKDVRLAYHAKCRRAFAALTTPEGEDETPAFEKFDRKYSPDDFVQSPGNHVVPNLDSDAYEANLADWIAHPKSSNVLVILFEEMLAYPERVLDRIALHLGYYTSEITEKILESVTGPALLRSRRCTEDFTAEQRDFLRARFGRGTENDARVRSSMKIATNVSMRGIFSDFRVIPNSAVSAKNRSSCDNSPNGTFRAPVVGSSRPISIASEASDASLDHGSSALTVPALAEIREKWRTIVFEQGGCSSYDSLYTKITGDEYPYCEAERGRSQSSLLTSAFMRLVARPRMRSRLSSMDTAGSQSEAPGSAKGEGAVCGRVKSIEIN